MHFQRGIREELPQHTSTATGVHERLRMRSYRLARGVRHLRYLSSKHGVLVEEMMGRSSPVCIAGPSGETQSRYQRPRQGEASMSPWNASTILI